MSLKSWAEAEIVEVRSMLHKVKLEINYFRVRIESVRMFAHACFSLPSFHARLAVLLTSRPPWFLISIVTAIDSLFFFLPSDLYRCRTSWAMASVTRYVRVRM